MADEDRIEVIVVGAGPAGLACAYALAKAGRQVVLLERGSAPGEKNMTGGRMYSRALDLLEPGFCDEAAAAGALERRVEREQIMLLSERGSMTVDFRGEGPLPSEASPPCSWTVLHSKFNAWLAQKAEAAGVYIAPGVRVDELLLENGQVRGVRSGEDDMPADLVVAADGVNSLLAASVGLPVKVDAQAVGVGIKEVIELPEELIEQRFCLSPGGGAARVVLGYTGNISGGGAVYTNRNSISLACVFNPAQAARQDLPLPELFQRFKLHPGIRELVEGGQSVEYGAHLVMESGWRNVLERPWLPGLLVAGEAAGYVINTGLIIRGIDLAILSGLAAARAVLSGKTGEELGPQYGRELENIGLNAAMRATQKWPDFMESSRLYQQYPDLAIDVLRQMFTVDDTAAPLRKRVMAAMRTVPLPGLLRDAWRAYRAL